jgi:hypothetical protein
MKDNKFNEEKGININSNSEVEVIDIISSIETPPAIPVEIPKSLGKNTWLYPLDEFGKMEKAEHYKKDYMTSILLWRTALHYSYNTLIYIN